MKTIVEALQELYIALGGKEEDVSGLVLNPDVIEQIAELAKNGGIGGGADNFVVHISFDETAQTFVISETYEDIKAALEGGKWVYGVSPDASTGEVMFLHVESYNSYEIQLCSNPIMTTILGGGAKSITMYVFHVGRNGTTGDTTLDFELRVGKFVDPTA